MNKPSDLKPREMFIGRGVSCRNMRHIHNNRIDVVYGSSLSPCMRAANEKSFWSGGQRDFT